MVPPCGGAHRCGNQLAMLCMMPAFCRRQEKTQGAERFSAKQHPGCPGHTMPRPQPIHTADVLAQTKSDQTNNGPAPPTSMGLAGAPRLMKNSVTNSSSPISSPANTQSRRKW